MAKPAPDALVRREILYGKPKRKPDFSALGQDYHAVGRLSDACEAFELIEDESERLKWIKVLRDDGIKAGNAFLLNRVNNSVELSTEEWRRTGENARKLGKLRYALKVAQRLEDAALVKELELELGIAQPEPPPEEGEGEATEASGD